ncbi:hypothetical protein [Pseudomonas vranovensis]|uniref:CBM-cenC domain-containing protein n=1 Tax=Pseudomonas vranovensis TaxID=321661 RepID=A0A423DMA0_9PSED|nr:hypothetical protein [Pseudomonas vranovensis]ROL72725.1 hypothetical protein BHU25_14025 [Pseudomonas vranovensis]
MELFIDHTDFESDIDPWNGWQKGPNGSMLTIKTEQGNHFAGFENFQGTLNGRILNKTLEGLTPATHYTISMRVRRQKDMSMTPSLWFELDGNELEGRIAVVDKQWQTLRWTFQATSITQHLELLGRDGTAQTGGDISFDDIRIHPITITENFDGQANHLIDPGQSIQLPTMTISLLEGPAGIKAGIERYAYPEAGMLEGEAIVLQRGVSNPASAQRLRIAPIVPCDKIKFAWTWRQRPGEVEFYDEQGQRLETLSFDGEPKHHWVEYQAPANRPIASLVITSHDHAFLDFFTLSQLPDEAATTLNTVYIDHTDFEPGNDPWNAWQKGPNGQALALTSDGSNHWAHFEGFVGNLLGRVMRKELAGLTPGTDYRLSMRVKRNGNSSKTPHLTFELDGALLEGEFAVTAPEWQTLRWQFRARAHSHTIELIGRDDTGNGSDDGADFSFDDIRIQPAIVHEDFNGHPQTIITAGQHIDLSTLRVTLLPGSTGEAAIQKHTGEVPGLQEKEGLAICRNQGIQQPQVLRFDLVGIYASLKFAWTWHDHPGQVAFFNAKGELLERRDVQPPAGRHLWIEFTAPTDNPVASLEVKSQDFAYLDFFTFTSA